MFPIFPGLTIPAHEIWYEFSHASGPGGQHVNKAATRATLCFAVASSGALSAWRKGLLARALANRIGKDGVLRVSCGTEREQAANRTKAGERFVTLLRLALTVRRVRKATRPTRASVQRRKGEKARRAAALARRRPVDPDAE